MTKPTIALRTREGLIPARNRPRCRVCGKPVAERIRTATETTEDAEYRYETTTTTGTGLYVNGGHFCTMGCATIWAVHTANELHGRISKDPAH